MRADPLFAGGSLFELPERRLGLEPVDEELAGFEGGFAVGEPTATSTMRAPASSLP